jgi:hypothetical protein
VHPFFWRGKALKKSAEHRHHAQECRSLARSVQNEEHRNQLLRMAEAWDNFAHEADRAERAKQQLMENNEAR